MLLQSFRPKGHQSYRQNAILARVNEQVTNSRQKPTETKNDIAALNQWVRKSEKGGML
jgi:hypothetical protein